MADNSHLFDILVGMQLDSSNLESQGKAAAAKFSKGFGVGFNASNIARPLGSISGKASEFQKSIEASSARVLAFGATTSAIFGLKASFDKLVESTIEVEKETTGINAIFGLSLSGLKSFTSGLLNAANQTGQSFAMASQAAQEFSRQGLSAEETLKRTRAVLILNRISGLDMADSISSLTSVINGFSKEALDATDIINRMTAVDTQFAVSAGDLASALQRVGASANDANVSFNQTLALVTAARQITGREGTVIGNALKTIFTRLQRPEVLNDLEEAGVQTRNLQGQVLPLTDVLKNLATTYDTLAQSQKSAVAESVGSVYQINILKGLLKDSASGASIYSGALNAIATASDTTSQRLDILNSTMASGIVRTMNDLTLAASNVGNALLGSAMKQGISVFDTLLKQVNAGFNNDKPKTTQQKGDNTAITAGISGVANVLSGPGIQIAVQLISKLLSNLVQFGYQSSKDLLGLDANMKQAIALEERYIELLEKDEALTQQILQGKIGIVEAGQRLMAQSNGNPVSNSILKSVVGVAVAETQRPNTSSVPNLAIGLEGINPEEFVMWEHNSGNILGKYKTQANAGRAADRYKNTYNSYNEVYKNPSYRTGLKGEYISYLGNVAIRNALYRENQATGGHAILSQSSKLMSEQNPHGFAAIDSRTQKNADDAIRQHEYLGQSINDISKNKTSAGFIPNLARQLAEIQRPNTSSVPNLFNPVQEALRKENALTGGNAALSSSPLLVTSQNPYGLAAIDSRNQKNATDAVMQHKFAGQTLSQIKNNRTKNSFVPNLANDFETSLFLGLAGAFTQSSTAISKFARIFPALYTAQERQLAEIQKTTQAYDKMVNSFRAGNNQPQAFGNKTYNSIEDVYGDKALTTQIAQQTDILKNATKIRNNERTNLIGTGFKTSLFSSGIGGVASTLGSEIGGKDFGAAVNELQSGITEAGQSLIAFPNRLGKALSAGFIASSFFSAFDSWTKHLNDARDKADAEQSRIKTLTDNIDTLSTSINNLNSMYLDATTQTQTLIDENQKYTEALASLSTQQGGGKIVNQLLTAPDEESKIGILAAQKEQLGIQNRLTQQILEAREESAKKSFLGFSSFGKQQGYTYDQDEDRSGEEETLKNNANLAISAMSATMQKTLGDTLLQGGDFTKQLNNPDNDFANSIIKELGGAHGGQAGIDKLLLEIQALLAQSAKYNDLAVIVARQKAVEGTQNAQFNVNNAVRTQQFLERLFLNQGSLAGGNVLDLRKLNYQTQYNQRALQLSGLENNANLFSQTHGERTTARYNYGVATQGAALQAQGQLNDLNIGTNRSLIESITRNADEILGKANPNAVPGEPNIGIGASNALFTQALNTGLTTVLKGSFSDLISKFKTTGGGFDYASFAKQVAQNSGINNTAVQGKVETYINSQQSIDILKTLNEGNVKQTDILQQFKQQSAENLQKLNATLAEADFKQQVQYLGGIESSLNRQSVKALERQVTRSAAILNNPNATNAAHAQASIQFLDSLKQLGVNLNKDNQEVRVLFDQAEQYIGQNLSDIFGKIQRNVGNVTGGQNSTLSTDITDLLGNINPYKAAQTQVEERYKPEGGVVPGSQGSSAFIDSTKFLVPFNQNLDDSTTQLYAFEQALQKTVAQLGGSAVNTQKAKDILGQTQNQGEKDLRIALDNLSGNLEKFKFQEPSQQNNPGKFGSAVSTIGFGALYGLGNLLFNKGSGFIGGKLFPKSQVGENISSSLGNETTESIEKAAESLEKVATKMEKSLGGSSGINLPGTYGPKGAGSSSARNIIRVNLPSKGGLTEIPKLEQDLEGGTNPAIRNFLPPSPPRIITPKLFNIGNTEKGYSKILQDADAARNEISQLVNNYGKSLNKIAQDISLGRKTLLRINGKDETEFSAWKGLDKQTVLNRLGEMGASPEKYKNDLYKEMQEEAMRRRIKLSNFIQKGRGINEDRIQRANQGTQENFENYSAASVQNSRNIDVQNQRVAASNLRGSTKYSSPSAVSSAEVGGVVENNISSYKSPVFRGASGYLKNNWKDLSNKLLESENRLKEVTERVAQRIKDNNEGIRVESDPEVRAARTEVQRNLTNVNRISNIINTQNTAASSLNQRQSINRMRQSVNIGVRAEYERQNAIKTAQEQSETKGLRNYNIQSKRDIKSSFKSYTPEEVVKITGANEPKIPSRLSGLIPRYTGFAPKFTGVGSLGKIGLSNIPFLGQLVDTGSTALGALSTGHLRGAGGVSDVLGDQMLLRNKQAIQKPQGITGHIGQFLSIFDPNVWLGGAATGSTGRNSLSGLNTDIESSQGRQTILQQRLFLQQRNKQRNSTINTNIGGSYLEKLDILNQLEQSSTNSQGATHNDIFGLRGTAQAAVQYNQKLSDINPDDLKRFSTLMQHTSPAGKGGYGPGDLISFIKNFGTDQGYKQAYNKDFAYNAKTLPTLLDGGYGQYSAGLTNKFNIDKAIIPGNTALSPQAQVQQANSIAQSGNVAQMVEELKDINATLQKDTSNSIASKIDFSTLPINITISSLEQVGGKSKDIANQVVSELQRAISELTARVTALDGQSRPAKV